MKKHLCILALVFLLVVLTVNAQEEPISIVLKSPGNGASIETYKVDFLYSFSGYTELRNCSLIVDNEVKGFRNTLFEINDNKITLQLDTGSHEWFMRCFDTDLNEMVSEKRTLSINLGGPVEGYETIYNYNGLRSYVITLFPGQKVIELPAMKGGEDIRIKMGTKTYYLDIIKMGVSESTNFVEVRDRDSGVVHRILVPSTISFDFDNDKTTDIDLYLKDVERNVNAYFIVTPYPGTAVEEESEEEPVTETTEEPQQEPVEQPQVEEEPEEEPMEEPEGEEVVEEEAELESGSKLWLVLIIVVVVLAVVLVILFSLKGRKGKEAGVKPGKVKVREKIGKIKPEKKKTKEEPKPGSESKEDFEDWPVLKEKFDIITSTGRKKKK